MYTAAEQCLTQSHGSLGRLPSAQGAVYQLLPHDVSAALGGLGDALVSPSVSIANDDYRSKVSGEANTDLKSLAAVPSHSCNPLVSLL